MIPIKHIEAQLPDDVHVETLFPDGVRLVLPRHRPPTWRWLAALGGTLPLVLMQIGFATLCFLSVFGVIAAKEGLQLGFIPFGLMFGGAANWSLIVGIAYSLRPRGD